MSDTSDERRIDPATKAAEAADARKPSEPDREPTEDEEEAAEEAAPVDEDVAETYEEQIERGAELEGEGRVEVADDGQEPLSGAEGRGGG